MTAATSIDVLVVSARGIAAEACPELTLVPFTSSVHPADAGVTVKGRPSEAMVGFTAYA